MDETTIHNARLSGGDHKKIRIPADPGDICRPTVAHGDGGIPVLQQHGDRLADHGAAPDNGNVLPPEGNPIVIQKFDAGLGSAGGKAPALPGENRSLGAGGAAVDVLLRKQGFAGGKLIEMGWQRTEYQTAVNGAVPIDPLNGGEQDAGSVTQTVRIPIFSARLRAARS